MPSLRLATRGSKLSLVQSDIAADALRQPTPPRLDYVACAPE